MKKNIFFFIIIFLCFFVNKADAQVSVHPTVISEVAYVRDGFDFTITIKNETRQVIRLYPLVVDILEEDGRIFSKDQMEKESSLASWVEIERGRINLSPEEEMELTLSIRVDSKANPGNYYAALIFARGASLENAQTNAASFNYPEVLININVERDIVERLQLLNFYHEKESFFTSSVDFFFNLENIGNTDMVPKGSLVVYKSRQGRELEYLPINTEEFFIEPGKNETFEKNWQARGSFGQHKAVLMIEYGDETKRDIYDTVYFWIIPQWLLFAFGIGLFLLMIFIIIILKKRKKKDIIEYYNTSTTLDLS